MRSELELDLIGALEGTDKASAVRWGYLKYYPQVISPWKGAAINLLEIGILGGQSLKMWSSYLPEATIVGVDINPTCARYAKPPRIQVEIGSQDDPGFLNDVCTKYPPTIIIDDGSHQAHHVIYTFERLFPFLQPGGLYIIEDTAFHFGDQAPLWKGVGDFSVSDYLSAFHGSLLARAPPSNQQWGTTKYLYNNVDFMTTIPGAVVLHKKKSLPSTTGLRDYAERYIAANGLGAEGHFQLAGYLRHLGLVEEAKSAARKSISMEGGTKRFHTRYAELCNASGAFDEAAAACRTILEIDPVDAGAHVLMGQTLARAGEHDAALQSFKKAASINGGSVHTLAELSHALERHGDIQEAISAARRAHELASPSAFKERLGDRIRSLTDRVKAARSD